MWRHGSMTLYVFGDSFASIEIDPAISIEIKEQLVAKAWSSVLSKKLGVELKNFGISGSSLEYTYYKFYQVRADLKEDDVVVIVLTDLFRKWIIKDRPVTSSLAAFETHNYIHPKLKKYAQWYFANVLRAEIEETHLHNFLYAVYATTAHLKVKPLFICAFDKISRGEWTVDVDTVDSIHVNNFAKGSLWEVSSHEITHQDIAIAVNTNLKKEFRLNHLSDDQHPILADKILNYIHNGTTVDLTVGFVKNIYKKQDLIKQGFL
jgi:hypothetical protein